MSATALTVQHGREAVKCDCGLVQFRSPRGACRKCKSPYESPVEIQEVIAPTITQSQAIPHYGTEWLAATMAPVLVYCRQKAGLSQEKLAIRMETQRTAISRIESGRTLPKPETLIKFGEATGYSVPKILLMCEELAKA